MNSHGKSRPLRRTVIQLLIVSLITIITTTLSRAKSSEHSYDIPQKADSSSSHSYEEFSFYNLLTQAPDIGRQVLIFLWKPSQFSIDWKDSTKNRIHPLSIVTWCVLTIAIIRALYKVVFKKPPFYIDYEALGKSRAHALIWLGKHIMFGYQVPEYYGPDKPTLVIYHLGLMYIWIKDVKPKWLSSRAAKIFFLVNGGITTAICTFPVAYLLGARVSVGEAMIFFINVITYTYFSIYLLVFPFTFIPEETDSDNKEGIGSIILGLVILMLVLVLFIAPPRSFLMCFMTYYGFGFIKIMVVFFCAFLLSALTTPLTLGPFLLIYYKFKTLIDVLT